MKIIITGASKGLGKVLAEEFSRSGHMVALVARSEDLLAQVCYRINANSKEPKAFFYACDLGCAEEVKRGIEKLISLMGGVDVLINNAAQTVKKGLMEMSVEEWQASVSTCVDAAFYCSLAVLPHLVEQGGGHIINISSLSTKIPLERGVSYGASKQALNGLSKSISHEFHGQGIKVCTIYPGAFTVDTEGENDWKMPPSEVYLACEYVLTTGPRAFIEELIVRPLRWPK